MLKQLLQQSQSENGKARLYAFENTVELTNLIPPTVSYESGGPYTHHRADFNY